MDAFEFTNSELTVRVKAAGAEMISLAHVRYGEMLWQAAPIWPQHAPNLFPIVGQLAGDVLRTGGAEYHLPRHGFARRRDFGWIDRNARGCTLELRDDAQTLAQYPFAFRLRITYALDGETLAVTYRIDNPGSTALPASVGAHPAFRWPLEPSIAKDAHALEFAAAEPAPIRRLQDGLLKRETFPTPVDDSTLRLTESLFADDAIVMDRLASRAVRYHAPGVSNAPAIDVAWSRFEQLGLWSKPGADFVCIEPWYGFASPVDFDGPFETKPGLLHIPPGGSEQLALRIRVGAS